jgi:hypothetical protein
MDSAQLDWCTARLQLVASLRTLGDVGHRVMRPYTARENTSRRALGEMRKVSEVILLSLTSVYLWP